MPNPEPDTFEDKLKKLLDLLEQDKAGIKRLVEQAYGTIQVATEMHEGNSMVGGPHLDAEDVRRMSALGLAIDFDLSVGGNRFRE